MVTISHCEQFLTVDNMKFMAFDGPTSGDLCKDCYFLERNNPTIACQLSTIITRTKCLDRGDNRLIIWMRIQ